MKLFVYGTLLSGEKNHHVLNGATLLVNGTLKARMYDTGQGYPAIELDPDFTAFGEIYDVPDHLWPALDELEGYTGNQETDLYGKEMVEVNTRDGVVEAAVYTVCDHSMKSLDIPSGNWVEYRKSINSNE